jgi:hypothetical protein
MLLSLYENKTVSANVMDNFLDIIKSPGFSSGRVEPTLKLMQNRDAKDHKFLVFLRFLSYIICLILLFSSNVQKRYTATVTNTEGKLFTCSYYKLTKWLKCILASEVSSHLMTEAKDANLLGYLSMCFCYCFHSDSIFRYGDITTGRWFGRLLQQCPVGSVPVTIDLYYDGWRLSHSNSVGGLYFTVSNLPKNEH